jgi:hypothetical protein
MKLKKFRTILISCLIITSLLFGGTAYAQDEELPLPDPGITPDSPFYFLDMFFEGMQEFFTFNPEAKARLHVAFAAERIAEIKVMLETKGVRAKGLDVAQARLEAHVARAVDIIESEQEKGSDVSALVHEILGDFHEQREAVKEAFGEAKEEFLSERKALQEQLRVANKDGNTALQERIRQELAAIEAWKDAAEAEKDEAIAAFEAERNRLRVRMEGELEDVDEGVDDEDIDDDINDDDDDVDDINDDGVDEDIDDDDEDVDDDEDGNDNKGKGKDKDKAKDKDKDEDED